MKRGLRPIKFKDRRTLDFHATFGTAAAIQYPDFNFDVANFFPDQNRDGRPNACTAYAENDIASNDDKGTYYNDQLFTYLNTKMIEGASGDVPVAQMDALKAGTVYGVKAKNETPDQALLHRRGPYFIVRPLNDYFDGMISAMQTKQGCLSIGTYWPPEAERLGTTGVVPSFAVPKNWDVGHCWSACGQKTIDGVQYIICKSWQGPNYGDGGYCYFSRKQVNDLVGARGSGAFGQKHVAPGDAVRVKMNILEVLISYYHQWLNILLGF